MAFKIPVEDRISTYPGRVVLTPVSGANNTYDMVRADMPIVEGTPINKVLFNKKADCLTEDVTVYVATTGSDTDGDGSLDAPFLTIQKAIDALPKNLGGFTAQVDIANGVYQEYVSCKGFIGGKLIFGHSNKTITISGVEFDNCSFVEVNVSNIVAQAGTNASSLKVANGSNVYIYKSLLIDGGANTSSGVSATYNSTISSINGVTVTANKCGGNAVVATNGSIIALYHIKGVDNFGGLYASVGGVITCESSTVTSYFGDESSGGGRIFTGGAMSILSVASLEE